jgi:hypothetical protein
MRESGRGLTMTVGSTKYPALPCRRPPAIEAYGGLWTILEVGLVRKEDSRLRGNALNMFINLSRRVRPTPGTTPKKRMLTATAG